MIKKDVQMFIRKHALQNAIQYGGAAKARPVIGKVLAERPELKPSIKELMPIINTIINEVNELSLSEQKKILKKLVMMI